jgi:hypothetical protein
MAKKEAAPAEDPKAKKAEKKPAEPEAKMVTSRELADQLGTKPTILRRYLRTLPKYQDGGYTRYKWDEKDPFLKDVKASFEKFKEDEKEKNAKRLATLKEKKEKAESKGDAVPKAGKKAAKKADPEPEPEEDDSVDELEDDEAESESEEESEDLE